MGSDIEVRRGRVKMDQSRRVGKRCSEIGTLEEKDNRPTEKKARALEQPWRRASWAENSQEKVHHQL